MTDTLHKGGFFPEIGSSTNRRIINLFRGLSETNRRLLLLELSIQNASLDSHSKDEPSNGCPYCKSRLIIKNGKRGELQKYRCKLCRHNLHQGAARCCIRYRNVTS